jgi:hypothetical protein
VTLLANFLSIRVGLLQLEEAPSQA